jgi:hypothetical protein
MKKLDNLYKIFIAFIIIDILWVCVTAIIFYHQGRL